MKPYYLQKRDGKTMQQRSESGKVAKAEGAAFETRWAWACRIAGIKTIRIPTGCRVIGFRGSRAEVVLEKTPFDWALAKAGKAAYLDTKSINDVNLCFSEIKPHQVDQLLDFEQQGHRSGYAVYFRKTGNVIFFKASQLHELQRRESLKEVDGEKLGTILDLNLANFLG